MGRRLKIDRPERVEVQLPGTIAFAMKAELYSDIEGRVPFGAVSELATQLITNWLRERGVTI